ncbi:MAG: NifU family protein [Planctomycetota bacterium]|nr:NifU family protein [Planctomycetota bacterium]
MRLPQSCLLLAAALVLGGVRLDARADIYKLVDADGTVKVRLRGACHGCPHAAMTIKRGVEARLREAIPEVAAVVLAKEGEGD